MTPVTILVAEDDLHLRAGLVETLAAEGYRVVAAADGVAALALFASARPDLVLLDVMMPARSGYEVCREIRRHDQRVPIIMLTAKGEEVDKVVGLQLGADDYVTKPFGIHELRARIAAVLRRAGNGNAPGGATLPIPDTFTFGAAEIDRRTFQARLAGGSHPLSAREMKLLEFFVARPGSVLSRNDLLNAGWGIDYLGTTRTLDQHIVQLRKKLEPDPAAPRYLQTAHGIGYRYQP
ncbi:MAG: DNA-binding response regulator [Desulfuromonadales bacterium GWD2_61_12]|nr:MAG: DNA-binding response regulator [Desulfuromonadales bacterium GWC2_61_20]OGR33695.1 MAG: DNA-binding response regulator [Desulfuromonadales bacterium GWD2_61_12]HAD03248.1 DNA-binding response regulator [Desulfuromonas sp.]HBT83735.1 DNA-binding response regulator [Desulfuromonas sp.]